jgi:NADPH-dependent glutamate synthase beta subunit-like oxidoreductase
VSVDGFSTPPEPDVYGPERVAPPPVPPELAARDDVNDVHYEPAPCQVACPIGTDAPSYIAHIWDGELEKAFEAITATNPFSSVCGRVCDAPCEPACRGRIGRSPRSGTPSATRRTLG